MTGLPNGSGCGSGIIRSGRRSLRIPSSCPRRNGICTSVPNSGCTMTSAVSRRSRLACAVRSGRCMASAVAC